MPPRRRRTAADLARNTGDGLDKRLTMSGFLREEINHVFPKNWSFMLGEIALYSFIILILTGTFLTFFYVPSDEHVIYAGAYTPLKSVPVSEAFNSTLQISFDVRGGLFIRQVHHWAADLFLASIAVHMFRVFFTAAFRKPREATWMLGVVLLWAGVVEGYCGYSLPDDNLSGTGVRIGASLVLSIPVVGTWLQFLIWGGEFPGHDFFRRIYIAHVLVIPGILLALIAIHLLLVLVQVHTQFGGKDRTEDKAVGERMFPIYAIKSMGLFAAIAGVLALLAGTVQINPIWIWGPYEPSIAEIFAQPDWYVGFLEGALRLFPPWGVHFSDNTLVEAFWPGVFLPVSMFLVMFVYPFLEARLTRDRRRHNLLQRPRDAPVRTAFGVMCAMFYGVLLLAGSDDMDVKLTHIGIETQVVAYRVMVFLVPAVAFLITYHICRSLQRDDRDAIQAGLDSGTITRVPGGTYVEVRQMPQAKSDVNA